MAPPHPRARHPAVALVGVAVVVAYAWLASGVRTFTKPAEVLTFLPGALVVVLAVRQPRRERVPDRWRRLRESAAEHRGLLLGAALWGLALTALVSWELVSLFSQPRSAHPTLSSITDRALRDHPARFAGYLAWLWLGRSLLRR